MLNWSWILPISDHTLLYCSQLLKLHRWCVRSRMVISLTMHHPAAASAMLVTSCVTASRMNISSIFVFCWNINVSLKRGLVDTKIMAFGGFWIFFIFFNAYFLHCSFLFSMNTKLWNKHEISLTWPLLICGI